MQIGDKIRVVEGKYIGKTGILLSAQAIRPAKKGQVITEKACKIKLDDTDESVDCMLCQIKKWMKPWGHRNKINKEGK